jgi:hypothetical protein
MQILFRKMLTILLCIFIINNKTIGFYHMSYRNMKLYRIYSEMSIKIK